MKRLPHALVVGLVLEALSSLIFWVVLVKSGYGDISPTWTTVTNGIDLAAHPLVAVGALQLARSLVGRAALGAKIIAVAQLALVAMVAFWISSPVWMRGDSAAIWKVFMVAQYASATIWLAVAVGFALVARPIGLTIALPIVAVVGIPLPVIGKLLYGGVDSATAQITLQLAPYAVVSGLALLAAWTRRDDVVVSAPVTDPADAFTRAGRALWLRVIAALSLAGFTFLVGMARSPDLMGLLRAVMLLAPVLDAIALALFARAVLVLARTTLAPWLLTVAAAFALAAVGMTAGRIGQVYELFYGHHDSGFLDLASREPVFGGFASQIAPLVAATGIALVLVAIGRLARERNAEDIRENVVIRTGVFVALMLGAMLMTHFVGGGSMSDAGVAVFLIFAIAGAMLYALVIAAKLCQQGAELVARDPAGLPTAKLVRS